jgi:hypothetical protein
LPLLRVRVLSSAVKDTGKPRVYGYVWADRPDARDLRQDLLTSWTWEHGWLLSTVFRDEQPGFGPGIASLLDTIRVTDVHAVVLFAQDGYARPIARRIERSGSSCLVIPREFSRSARF